MDDERRGHQTLLLHSVMRMHPVRAGNRSIVISLNGAVCERWGLRPRETILRPGRKLPMPVDEGRCASLIDEVHAKPLAARAANAWASIRAAKFEDLGWPAVHLEHACAGDEMLRNRECRAHSTGQRPAGRQQRTRREESHGENRAYSRP